MRKLKSSKKSTSKLKSSAKFKLSACYIVKNEEKTLSKSIESLKNQVDEIIIVDTGSTDKTIEIAKSYGAEVIETAWEDDFSKPRNLAIENATGDWIIMIDADEFFIKPNKVRAAVEKLADNEVIFMPRIDIDEDDNNKELNRDYYLRAFRNVDYLRYRGLIHENIENINGGNYKYKMAGEDLTLYHTGYSTTKAESKLRRNLAIIQKEISKTGIQLRHHIALVDCYFALNDYEKTWQHAKEILATDSRPVTGLEVFYRKTLYAMRQLRCPLEQILKVLNEALTHFPKDSEFLMQQKIISEYINQNSKG